MLPSVSVTDCARRSTTPGRRSGSSRRQRSVVSTASASANADGCDRDVDVHIRPSQGVAVREHRRGGALDHPVIDAGVCQAIVGVEQRGVEQPRPLVPLGGMGRRQVGLLVARRERPVFHDVEEQAREPLTRCRCAQVLEGGVVETAVRPARIGRIRESVGSDGHEGHA